MTKLIEKRLAINLRKQGKSYSEIKDAVNVSKSSLSIWLRNIPLSKKQLLKLRTKKERTIERYRKTMRAKHQKRLDKYYTTQHKKWIPLSEREIFIAGLFLYSGEGDKTRRGTIAVSNTDPSVIRFTLFWLKKSLNIANTKIKVQLHLYSDMDHIKETLFWKKELRLRNVHFLNPYIKKTRKSSIDQKGFGHGTCTVYVNNTVIKENLMMTLKAIYDTYA